MINWEAIEQAGLNAGAEAIQRGAELIATRAKEKAPVRRVFRGQDESVRYRLKSISEIEGDRDIRRQIGLGPEGTHLFPPLKVTKRAPQLLHQRALPVDVSKLSRRGRYELRSGRSIDQNQLGGRLRREIHATRVKIEERLIRAQIISPTPYAKYMEFGTRHNAAHPYLRPAGHESKAEIRRDVAVSVAAAAQAAIAVERVDVVWTLKG